MLIIGLLVGFGVVSILFLLWQWYYGAEALLPLHIVTQRTVAATIASSFFLSGAVLVYTYYLPYWFQAIKNASALESGVDTIPYVASSFVAAILGAVVVNKTGYLNIPLLAGPILATIGAGLLYTLQVDTPTARWVGFEILGAAGAGMAVQQYFLAIQATLPAGEVPIGTALVLFSQNLAGAIFVSVGSSIIRNKLLAGFNDPQFAGVDIQAILTAGATDFRALVNIGQLQPLLTLYNSALQNVFIMAVPLTVLALICALPVEWNNLKGRAMEQAHS
ncbi:hypothetical protein NHQ30_003485 [Ciborinia camelliae]|nr:hypothetical protein NHQ30_003485 [Ciborinia camelliae]